MTDQRKEEFQILLAIDGKRSFSVDRLFALMDKINTTGSISKAAAALNVSYRYAWGLFQEAEKELGMELVIKQVGGAEGGGTIISPQGNRLLHQYKSLKQDIDSQLAELLGNHSDEAVFMVPPANPPGGEHFLLMASTIGPVDTGLMEALEQAYYKESGVLVRHIAAGSGRALDIARMGRVDLVLVHAEELERTFIEEGFGIERRSMMSNRFYLTGPRSDPAALQTIKEEAGVVGLFRQIALTQKPFISRGDRSGTHLREQKIWDMTGMALQDSWYITSPGVVGNRGVLQLAMEKEAYTLIDSGTYWQSQCQEHMAVYAGESENEALLMNRFSLILVDPERFSHINQQDARAFIHWLTEGRGKDLITGFGVAKSGRPLFEVETCRD